MKLVLQRGKLDCGIAAIASLLEVSYEDAYVAVGKGCRKRGMNNVQVIAAAARFGVKLAVKARPALEDDEGILVVNWSKPDTHLIDSHFVMLLRGVIADVSDGVILPADEYLSREWARPGSLLTEA